MGCDVIAPSDMMDGRIGKIRKALDKKILKMFSYYLTLLNMHQISMVHLEMLLDQKSFKGDKKHIKWIIKIQMKH